MHHRRANKYFRYTVTAILAMALCTCSAQVQWSVTPMVGVGSYSLNSLHEYQDYVQSNVPVKMTKTDEFPAYYTYGVDLGCRLSQLLLYVGYVHGSTAGRQSYSDYSGELTAEQLVRYNSFSFGIAKRIVMS